MKKPESFYKEQISKHTETLKTLKKQLALSGTFRLLVFLALCAGVYFTFGNTKFVIAIILGGIALFVFLVSRHSNLQYKRDVTKALLEANNVELEVLSRAFHHLPDGEKYKNPEHYFSQDIDLFGRGSFYQYINRTALESGSDHLAHLLTDNDIDNITKKQEAIQELAKKATWRQHFSAVASLVKTEVSANTVLNWLNSYKSFVPNWIKVGSTVFSIISLGLLITYFSGFISGYIVFGWFLAGLIISGRYLKKVNDLSQHTAKIQSTFEQFHKLLLEIETEDFSSDLLSEKKKTVVSETDLRQSYNIEKWISEHSEHVSKWIDSIVFFDAYNTLANYVFNHPQHVFPAIVSSATQLQADGAGHPLLDPEKMVRNDFKIASEEFFIVTGANMAGKSTFLRTVALQIVMANVGLPVCATKSTYQPIKLITSMRTTDSLTDDESYFFSELKRLKFIVEEIKTDRYFIILDEILKGTNSTDKAIGSKKFVEKLVAGNATGIIATHDLSLCEVSESIPNVKNYFFDARIEDDELYFDYTFQPGICQNMNASFLLKKMEIVD